MSIFKEDKETKRVIFNIDIELATRLERAKECARLIGKKLDVDSTIDKELEKFLKKAEKKFIELGVDIEAVKLGEQPENPSDDREESPPKTKKEMPQDKQKQEKTGV